MLFLLLFSVLSATALASVTNKPFFCNQLFAKNQPILTFEYRNPQTRLRGVTCVLIDPSQSSVHLYLEEESGRTMHRGAIGFAKRADDGTLIGNLWKFVGDKSEPLQDSLPVTLAHDKNSGLYSMQFSGMTFILYPRNDVGVANWRMTRALIPETCPVGMFKFTITDPVRLPQPNRHGIVCLKVAPDNHVDFFSFGARRGPESGALRRFVNFGRMQWREGSSFDGAETNFAFTCDADEAILPDDHHPLIHKFNAIRSVSGKSFLLVGDDVQERWFHEQIKPQEIDREIYLK